VNAVCCVTTSSRPSSTSATSSRVVLEPMSMQAARRVVSQRVIVISDTGVGSCAGATGAGSTSAV
jgi:hypothetical protein